ncbi:MAG: hypothetical protein AAGC88_09720 [Bacteroidota bacterium]
MAKKKTKTLTYIEETPKHHNELVKVARRGVKESIQEAKDAGLYITYVKGSEIVREYPDGRLETIGAITEPPTIVEPGTQITLP